MQTLRAAHFNCSSIGRAPGFDFSSCARELSLQHVHIPHQSTAQHTMTGQLRRGEHSGSTLWARRHCDDWNDARATELAAAHCAVCCVFVCCGRLAIRMALAPNTDSGRSAGSDAKAHAPERTEIIVPVCALVCLWCTRPTVGCIRFSFSCGVFVGYSNNTHHLRAKSLTDIRPEMRLETRSALVLYLCILFNILFHDTETAAASKLCCSLHANVSANCEHLVGSPPTTPPVQFRSAVFQLILARSLSTCRTRTHIHTKRAAQPQCVVCECVCVHDDKNVHAHFEPVCVCGGFYGRACGMCE